MVDDSNIQLTKHTVTAAQNEVPFIISSRAYFNDSTITMIVT